MEGAIPCMSTILDSILARLAKMEVPRGATTNNTRFAYGSGKNLRGDVNILLEDKSTLLPKEKNSTNIFHTGPSEQELPLAEVP